LAQLFPRERFGQGDIILCNPTFDLLDLEMRVGNGTAILRAPVLKSDPSYTNLFWSHNRWLPLQLLFVDGKEPFEAFLGSSGLLDEVVRSSFCDGFESCP